MQLKAKADLPLQRISVATFYRLFRQATGTTPAKYLNHLRMKKACLYLTDTDDTIGKIAHRSLDAIKLLPVIDAAGRCIPPVFGSPATIAGE